MRRQNVLVIVLASLFALLLISYFVFIKPINSKKSDEKETEKLETEDGEALGYSGRYFLFTSLEKEDIKSIEVKNETGNFSFVSDEKGNFSIKGFEKLNLDTELFSKLISVSTYTLSKTKVGSSLSDDKIAEYGLDAPRASWVVTDKKDNRFRVFVGDRLLTGGGYYCMFDGRKSVYVLGNEVEDTILVPLEKYVKAVLSAGISNNDYYTVDNFTIFREANPFLRIRLVPHDKQNNPEALAENIIDFPTSYYPNTSLYYETIYGFMSLCADECVKIGATDTDYEKYGLKNPQHIITFDYHGSTYELFFSKLTDNSYYAYSNLYPDVIGKVSGADFKYLEYDLIKWIDPYVFQQYITKVDEISVSCNGLKAKFEIDHLPSQEKEKNEDISVTANGRRLSDKMSQNFREFYKTLLSVAIKDYCRNDEYCKLTDKEIENAGFNPDEAYLTFSYKDSKGEGETFSFYKYSTGHSLVCINGVGEFYVLTDLVDKIYNDTQKILKGEEVDSYAKN